jgi:predicted ribosomally synthesized peptide with nif11-like leader
MSEEQLKAFLEAIQADAGLHQKLRGVTEPDAVAAIAKEAGFSISVQEILAGKLTDESLTDEQLETVAGGAQYTQPGYNTTCNCPAGG